MRLYSFVNYYLSPLQHGLQTAHCVSEMSLLDGAQRATYEDWAERHKTIIICNGGNTAMLEDLHLRLTDLADQCRNEAREGFALPVVKFYEDEQSLNNALTSVALIIPSLYYDVEFVRGTTGPNLYVNDSVPEIAQFVEGTPEYALIALIKSHRLA